VQLADPETAIDIDLAESWDAPGYINSHSSRVLARSIDDHVTQTNVKKDWDPAESIRDPNGRISLNKPATFKCSWGEVLPPDTDPFRAADSLKNLTEFLRSGVTEYANFWDGGT